MSASGKNFVLASGNDSNPPQSSSIFCPAQPKDIESRMGLKNARKENKAKGAGKLLEDLVSNCQTEEVER